MCDIAIFSKGTVKLLSNKIKNCGGCKLESNAPQSQLKREKPHFTVIMVDNITVR